MQTTDETVGQYLRAITYLEQKLSHIEMIVAVVPNDNKTRYDAIKKHCCLETGSKCTLFLRHPHDWSFYFFSSESSDQGSFIGKEYVVGVVQDFVANELQIGWKFVAFEYSRDAE